VRLLVRTWNLFHGNAKPPERRAFLEEMVRLASVDRPDVLCLQELPVWSLRHLAAWTGMTSFGAIAARPKVPPELGRRITELDTGFFRSFFVGQANALLFDRSLRVFERRIVILNPFGYRRREARRLGLGLEERIVWLKERRVCQVARLAVADGATFVAANLHATGHTTQKGLAEAEVLRAATFADGFARPGEPVLLAGDFNLTIESSRVLPRLVEPEWGFSGATRRGIDHVLSRGLALGPPVHWPDERRRVGGRLLSDHSPVERRDA
jgi:endonuclease/exonuclease/phosphatase family metal-dependent hydrolase